MITRQVNVEASHTQDTLNISLDITQEEWDELSPEQQTELLQNEVNENPNQPYWVVA